jgi:hypothetical protein
MDRPRRFGFLIFGGQSDAQWSQEVITEAKTSFLSLSVGFFVFVKK